MEILKAAKNLNQHDEYKKIYINNDYTSAQLEANKKQRLDRNELNAKFTLFGTNGLNYGLHKFGNDEAPSKFFWGIRNNEIRKIKITE